MTSRRLPPESKDELHLRERLDSLLSAEYAKGLPRRDIPLSQLRAHFEEWVTVGAAEPDQWAEYVEYNEEVTSYENIFRGRLISGLRESALSMTGSDREVLESIPVGMFPLETFNGWTDGTPHGGAIIVLNEAVINILRYVLHCIFAIAVGRVVDLESTSTCVDVLVGLARVATTGDIAAAMKPHHLPILTTFAVPDDNFNDLAIAVEEFILLHEYGHVLLGHLDLPRAQHHEFEADEYALARMLSRYPEERVAVACGSLMYFFWLCEILLTLYGVPAQMDTYLAMTESHPPAHARWERIKAITNVAERDDVSNELDETFAYIGSIAGVIVLHEKLVALARLRRTGP
jgi:hypothetical protein